MATLKKYDLSGKEVGSVAVDDAFLEGEAHAQLVKDYLVALRANLRQWSANTKGRSEVSHSTKKPHRQKGTGSARQGTLAAPQYRGGGIVFGPKPKFDQHVQINKREKRKVVRFLIGEKIRANSVFVIDDEALSTSIEKPQTKLVVSFLKALDIHGKKVLFLGPGNYETIETEFEGKKEQAQIAVKGNQHQNFIRSMRNIPRTAFRKVALLNGMDLMNSKCLVITESGLNELISRCAP